MTPARLAIHECRMQFPQHRAPPRNHTVGIATLTHTIENSPNRIARKTTPSARTSTYVGPTACAWAPHRPEARPHRHQTGGVALHEDPCATCLPVTSPPNGGNCTIRGATRRRHADRTLLMLQNPPSSPGCGGGAEVNCVPESPASQNIWAITPMPAIVRRGGLRLGRHIPANSDLTTRGVTSLTVNGGNCTIRGATRRQNPPNAAKPPPLPRVSCSLAGAGLPGGRHTTPNRGLTATKRGELHH